MAPPARSRLIFLDIDGTYADRGVVPPGHVRAVAAARAAGNRVLLCTGRPKSMLTPHILAAGFDGMVASAGAWVEVDGEVLRDLRFPDDLAARTVEVLDRTGAAYVLEAPDAIYGRAGVAGRLRSLLSGHQHEGTRDRGRDETDAPGDILAALRTPASLDGCSFAKVTYFEADQPRDAVRAAIGAGAVDILPSSISALGDRAGEIHPAGMHKALGIGLVLEHLGAGREDVVAFGDGPNDLEMLEYAGTAVGVAGGDERVLALADHVAAAPAAEGLVAAFAELGLTAPPGR
jgi:Cof subfamily protein (haloacid dehalogenase superfamily)